MWRKENLFALLVGMQTGAAPEEKSIEILHKIKNESAFGPSNFTSGNICEETTNIWKQGTTFNACLKHLSLKAWERGFLAPSAMSTSP